MSRRCSATIAQRNAPVVQQLQGLTATHPFWGSRRIWAHLRVVDGRVVNTKRVLRQLRSGWFNRIAGSGRRGRRRAANRDRRN